MLSYGKIVQVSGPVVDCEFQEGQLPKIREALRVQVEDEVRTMEVAQHMDEHTVRCIMLAPSEGLSRGMTVEATGRGISVPVGDATLGRMFNVLGDPIDGGEALPASTEKWSIHRQAPSFAEQSPVVSILETGIKVIDLLEPYAKGGKNRPVWRRWRRQNGSDSGADYQRRVRTRRLFHLHRRWRAQPRGQRPLERDDGKRRHFQDGTGLWADERSAGRSYARGAVRA